MEWRPRVCSCVIVGIALCGCAMAPSSNVVAPSPSARTPAPVAEVRPGLLAGYLGKELPDSLKLLPAPPSEGSTAFGQDKAVSRASQKLRGSPRYAQATLDADLTFPHAANAFACALGVPITPDKSPYLYQMLRRVMTDAALATYGAKDHYKRTRPFVYYEETTCSPGDEDMLRNDGSYPSGHTSIGWAWALILTQLAPDRADALLARGRSFGESRLVCNAHWQSDVLEGRAIGAGAVAKLQSDAGFKSDMAAAGREIEALRGSGQPPNANCQAEADALAVHIGGTL